MDYDIGYTWLASPRGASFAFAFVLLAAPTVLLSNVVCILPTVVFIIPSLIHISYVFTSPYLF